MVLLRTTSFLAAVLFLGGCALGGCDTVGVDVPPTPEAGVRPWGEMLQAVNRVRGEGATCGSERMAPAPPLIWDSRLERAAEGHARDMARHNYLSHRDRAGRGTGERVRDAGYRWRAVGENLARNQASVDQAVGDWLASPGHCRMLLDPGFAEIGAAEEDGYWVQVFGVPN